MSFISVFDVLGPNMIGPSSSHTAGAARIGFLAQKMIGGSVIRADFTLYGSFAKTYHGHGTDRALLGGINNYLPPVFVLVCRASLDSNSCFLNFWVGRIHLTTLLLYIFLMYHIGTTKYIIPLYKRISNDNITFSI